VVIVGAAVAAWTVAGVSDTVRTERTQSVASETTVQTQTVGSLVSSLQTNTEQLAETTTRIQEASSIGSGLGETEQLYRDRVGDEVMAAVHLADGASGEILVSSNPEAAGATVADRGYDVPTDLGAGETTLTAQTDGSGSWVVYSRLPSRLGSVLDETTTRIVAADGTVVYDSRNESVVGTRHTTETASPAVRAGLQDVAGTQTVSAANSTTGTELIVGHDGVDGTEWAVVSYAEPGALFQVVDGLRTDLFVLLGAITALLVGFVLTVERPALRELQSLRSDVETLREGELDTAVETDRADEIGDLGRGLETMRVDLRDQVAEAERATAEAETAREEAEALSEELVTKAEAYRESMNKLADGEEQPRRYPRGRRDAQHGRGRPRSHTRRRPDVHRGRGRLDGAVGHQRRRDRGGDRRNRPHGPGDQRRHGRTTRPAPDRLSGDEHPLGDGPGGRLHRRNGRRQRRPSRRLPPGGPGGRRGRRRGAR
jgi:methyl-accepting chemotaxis protein